MLRLARHCAAGLVVVLASVGCESSRAVESAQKKGDPPAKVEKLPGEADLTTIHLSAAAEQRLGIAVAAVERREVGRTRLYGGEVTVPPGRSAIVSAPLSGTVLAPADGKPPQAGDRVKLGDVVFRLLPLLSPEARATLSTTRVEAMGQIDQAEKQQAQAKIQRDRAERLQREKIGGAGALEDAKAQFQIAEAALKAAQSRHDALDKTIKGIEGGTIEPLTLHAEADGMIKAIHVQPGQAVAAGGMLFDVESLDPAWIRVPIYVGDRRQIEREGKAEVGDLDGGSDSPTYSARPVAAPPSGDPLAATVSLFYEVANADDTFWPGQRVGVRLPLAGRALRLVVPRACLLSDIHGGTWVYQKTGPLTYRRVRVRPDHLDGDRAILIEGPAEGAEVVTAGAAELFGTEFGTQ